MEIKFLGATRTVTGSCYLIKTNGNNMLVDCGMFQGVDMEERNYEEFDFDAKSIDFVFLTHSHLDHCGLLPKLYREGFRGKIFMTIPTRNIAEHMLLDSAKIQENRFRDSRRQQKNNWQLAAYNEESEEVTLNYPIYDTRDVLNILNLSRVYDYNTSIRVNEDINFRFLRAGHALGASSLLLSIQDRVENKNNKILFSGDLGNPNQNLDNTLDFAKETDYLITESLYGGEEHDDINETTEKFSKAIIRTLARGGNVLIPSFTYQRTQEMLYICKKLIRNKTLPSNIQIFLDSPLAIKITEVYKKHFKYLNPRIIKEFKSGYDLFYSPNISFVQTVHGSKRLNRIRNAVIIAGHGMCAGGRILHHLIRDLSDAKSSVLFVGFQAPGTLGREIIDGKKEVNIDKKIIKVKAEIVKLFGFSAHAGNNDLLNFIGHLNKQILKQIFLVHAEEGTSLKFKDILLSKGYNNVVIPEWKKNYKLS
jgi:metallo-beta-lactamase family protein